MSANRDSQKQLLKDALGEIESLRIKRQRQYVNQPHPSLKRFTQQELNDEACLTYKNLLVSRSHRLPDRATILRIAEYLECTFDERNDLLSIAGYLPFQSELQGQFLERELEQARQLVGTLSFPAMIVTPALEIKGFNELFTHLFDLSRDFFYENSVNLIDFHFSSDLPIRTRSTFDGAAFEQWESHAINGIHAFKRNHLLSRHDDWYKNLVRKLYQYGGDKYWNMRADETKSKEHSYRTLLVRTDSSSDLVPIRYNQVYLSVGRGMYPGIGIFLPVDELAREVFASIGSSVDYSNVIAY